MATKEDILEQLIEEYLLHKGYFVRHNVKFLPRKNHPDFVSNQDSNHSDIDVIGFHPLLTGPSRVLAVSCKSWQGGFDPASEIRKIRLDRKVRGRAAWKGFRELVSPKWSEAFIDAVFKITGEKEFTYVTAVTKLIGDKTAWETNTELLYALKGNPIQILELKDVLNTVSAGLGTTLAGTDVGRMLQLFKAAGLDIEQ